MKKEIPLDSDYYEHLEFLQKLINNAKKEGAFLLSVGAGFFYDDSNPTDMEKKFWNNRKRSLEELKIIGLIKDFSKAEYEETYTSEGFKELGGLFYTININIDKNSIQVEPKNSNEEIIVKENINIADIIIKIINNDEAQIYLKGSKKHKITKEKLKTTDRPWELLRLLSMGNIIGAKTDITIDTLISTFKLHNPNLEKNKNTIQQHKSELDKKLKKFLSKYYIWNNNNSDIIYYHNDTKSYKTKFKLEPISEFRNELRLESKGFNEESLSYQEDSDFFTDFE